MSLAGYSTAVASRARGDLALWLEIEGLPYAYGTVSKDSTWFASRAAGSQFLGIRSWFAKDQLPTLPTQELDHLEGAVGGGALTLQIVDVDGSLTELTACARTDGRCVFASDVSATELANQTVTGDTSTWASTGAAYVGYEAFTYSAKTSTSVDPSLRGAYRSRATSHAGGVVSPGVASNGSTRIDVGDIITPYPTKLEGRRVWLHAGHSPASDADCTEVWSGVIEQIAFGGPDLRTLAISCSQSFGELNQPAFSGLGTFGLDVPQGTNFIIYSRTQPGGPESFTSPETYRFATVPENLTTTASTAGAKRRHFIADAGTGVDVLRCAADLTTPQTSISVSKLAFYEYASDAGAYTNAGGSLGSFVSECVYIADGEEPFTAGVHPLQVLLQCLLSDEGMGVGYDTLPSRFGIGLSADRVDVAGIEDLIAATPDLKIRTLIAKPVEKFGEWARTNLLKPFGFFLRPSLGNLLSVGRMGTPTPVDLANAVGVSQDDVISLGGWESDVLSIVGTVVWHVDMSFDRDEREVVWRNTPPTALVERDGRIVALDYPKARTLEVDAKTADTAANAGLYDGRPFPARDSLLAQLATRFSQPVAILTLTVTLKHILREVGDFVNLTHPNVPSRTSATRGVATQLWEVVGKRVDFKRASVDLTLRQTAVADIDSRYLAPAMAVDSVAGNDVTIDPALYVAAGQDATAAFEVGDYVRAYDPTSDDIFVRSTARIITGIATPVVTLNSAASITGGMVLIHADYTDWDALGSAVGAATAFRATESATLIDNAAGVDDPAEMA